MGPSEANSSKLSETVSAAKRGDRRAAAELLPLLYGELRGLGRALLQRKPPGQTLQATALVHEAYARLVSRADSGWDGRGHFFGAAARAMRDILVEDARRKAALKRGGDRERSSTEPDELPIDALRLETPCEDILALNDALELLESEDPDKARLVLLRFFAGLSMQEIADELEVSKTKVERDWRFVRAWLHAELGGVQFE